MQFAQGNLAAALQSYSQELAITDRLAKADPSNAGGQRDLATSYAKIGEAQVAQGNLAAALQSMATALLSATAWPRPIPTIPNGNAISQCCMKRSVTCRSRAKATSPPRSNFRDSLAIRDRLAKADPNNAEWQRDRAVSYSKLADYIVDPMIVATYWPRCGKDKPSWIA